MAKVHFYYSAMNAGKSTTLLQSSYNYQERGMDTLLYCPKVDDRVGAGIINTRIGLTQEANTFDNNMDLFEDAKQRISDNSQIRCMLIDEAQFLTKQQVKQICQIADQYSIPVLAYGLRSDFQGEPFEGSLYLLTWADVLIEIKTICHCGRKATMNLRINSSGEVVDEGDQVFIGGNESYISACRKHFYAKQPQPRIRPKEAPYA